MQKKYWLFTLVFLLATACGGGSDDPNPTPDPDPDPEPVENPYEDCLVEVSDNTIELVTWNIQNFPKLGSTVEYVEEIIESYDADVIAVQEITSLDDFEDLIEALDGWGGHVEHVSGSSQRLGYLYKESEITVVTAPMNLFEEDTDEYDDAFTSVRRPLYMRVEHTSGTVLDLITVHLKCCDGSEDRRRSASELIKAYIDDNLSTDNVVVLGDFNDEIVDQEDNVFQNFIDDADNFKFATMPLAQGPSSDWSYPSWPSQIDQILISNELFDNELYTNTIKPGGCLLDYSERISDHRPVIISLSAN